MQHNRDLERNRNTADALIHFEQNVLRAIDSKQHTIAIFCISKAYGDEE